MMPRNAEQLYDYVNRYWWCAAGAYPTPEECESIVLTVAALLHLEKADNGTHDYLPIPRPDNKGTLTALLG